MAEETLSEEYRRIYEENATPITREQLLPGVQKRYDELVQKNGGKPIPLLLTKFGTAAFGTSKLDSGRTFIEINTYSTVLSHVTLTEEFKHNYSNIEVAELKPEKLLPAARERYDQLVKENGGRPLPILLSEYGSTVPRLDSMDSERPFVSVNEGAHFWTVDDAHRSMYTNKEIDAVSSTPYPNAEVAKRFAEMAAKLGIVPVPQLRALAAKQNSGSAGTSIMSQEAVYTVFLDPDIPPRQAMAVMAHELGHIKNGDLTPRGATAYHNDESMQTSLASERRADSVAVQLCQGNELAEFFIATKTSFQTIASANNRTLIDLENSADPGHPIFDERINFARQGAEIEQRAGRCPVDPAVAKTMRDSGVTGGQTVQNNGQPVAPPSHTAPAPQR